MKRIKMNSDSPSSPIQEFDGGEDQGEVRLFQHGKQLSGYLIFKEIIPGEPPLYIRTKLTGKTEAIRVKLSNF